MHDIGLVFQTKVTLLLCQNQGRLLFHDLLTDQLSLSLRLFWSIGLTPFLFIFAAATKTNDADEKCKQPGDGNGQINPKRKRINTRGFLLWIAIFDLTVSGIAAQHTVRHCRLATDTLVGQQVEPILAQNTHSLGQICAASYIGRALGAVANDCSTQNTGVDCGVEEGVASAREASA